MKIIKTETVDIKNTLIQEGITSNDFENPIKKQKIYEVIKLTLPAKAIQLLNQDFNTLTLERKYWQQQIGSRKSKVKESMTKTTDPITPNKKILDKLVSVDNKLVELKKGSDGNSKYYKASNLIKEAIAIIKSMEVNATKKR